jgi:hypothetical protein
LYICIIAVLFVGSLVAWDFIRNIVIENPVAEIYKDGELIERIALTRDKPDFIVIEDGGNKIHVGHKVYIIHADCSAQICVNTGFIDSGIFPIICVPNRLEIRIVGGENPHELDAVAR